MVIYTYIHRQDCIPVGCIPPACCPYLGGSGPGGCLVWGGLVPGGCIPACNGADLPPVNRITVNFVVHNCLRKVTNSLKTVQNYIMNNCMNDITNDINDKRPFRLHEQSWLQNSFAKNDIV